LGTRSDTRSHVSLRFLENNMKAGMALKKTVNVSAASQRTEAAVVQALLRGAHVRPW
jgi:hypothetical protein